METIPENIRFAARLSLHEFLLEQIISNALLREQDPVAATDAITSSLLKKMQFSAWSGSDSPDLIAVQKATVELAKRFCAKVRARVEKP